MIKYTKSKILMLAILMFSFLQHPFSQEGNLSILKIKDIMQGDDFVGHLPHSLIWSTKSDLLYFSWRLQGFKSDSLFCYQLANKKIVQLNSDSANLIPSADWVYSEDKSKAVFDKDGDIYLLNLNNGNLSQITKTKKREYNPYFTSNEQKIAYNEDENIFCWDIATGFTEQITDFVEGYEIKNNSQQVLDKDKWLEDDQLRLFSVLNKQEEKRKDNEKKRNQAHDLIYKIYLNSMFLAKSTISPDGKYITYMLSKQQNVKSTNVPNYVTKSGYTENINARAKVGEQPTEYKMFIYNILKSKTYEIDFSKLDGINDLPAYLYEYPQNNYQNKNRIGNIEGPFWSGDGTKAFIDIRANDNKDRWLALINFENGELKMLNRQHDDAWIEGPGIGYFSNYSLSMGWMPDDNRIWFQSEENGYSNLYAIDINSLNKKALTSGQYEVYNPVISNDKKYWYFSSNQNHPGVVDFYRMPIDGGKAKQLTNMVGNNEVFLSPDETKIAIRYSFSNKPWEIYLMDNPAITGKDEKTEQITLSTTKNFNNYKWMVPEIVTFKTQDGNIVYARLYKPKDGVKNKAAILFVHGAGYLQNAHQWWSDYFREYMFHNLLVDNGYTVLDIDYRGSAGYGRNWRTGIYRHMGGKDLSDQVDGAKYLIKNWGIDKNRIGIYGGSYGGFITLMAMFKEGDTFKAGAAIRSVTDWAHYNNIYTSNILNTPLNDSIAYYQSSPIYYANGLKGNLLMLHGIIDDNVHFQDVVRLSQKLIELGKENWDLAIYPVERHAFTEPSSWSDEYTRIFKFFKNNLIDK